MNDQHYVYITNSEDSINHPNNIPHDFTVSLSPPIYLDPNQDWSVAVTEIELMPGMNQTFCLCIDLCEGVHTGGKQLPLLRKLYPLTGGVKQLFTFNWPYYVKVKQKEIDKIRVYISDEQGVIMPLSDLTLKYTLHLRRYSPWHSS